MDGRPSGGGGTVGPTSGELRPYLVAIAVPVVMLAAIVGLIAGIRALERSRDELVELGVLGR